MNTRGPGRTNNSTVILRTSQVPPSPASIPQALTQLADLPHEGASSSELGSRVSAEISQSDVSRLFTQTLGNKEDAAGAYLAEQIEQLQLINVNRGSAQELLAWSTHIASQLDKNALEKLGPKQSFQLAALLTKFCTDIPNEALHTLLSALPADAKEFYEELMAAGTMDIDNFLETVPKFSKAVKNSPQKILKTACFINTHTLSLSTILKTKILQKEELVLLADDLRYANFTGLESNDEFYANLLPSLTQLLYLEIHNDRLTYLPNLTMLRHLDCTKCHKLESLPDQLPHLRALQCAACPLDRLPQHMPRIETLDCSRTPVTEIPTNLPKLMSFRAAGCLKLKELPQRTDLMKVFDYADCPQFPPSAQVLATSTPSGNSVTYHEIELKSDIVTNPMQYLLKVGRFLLEGRGFPKVRAYDSENRPLVGKDDGGLSRDFVTTLFSTLFHTDLPANCAMPCENENGLLWPIADDSPDVQQGLCSLGAILAACYQNETGLNLKTGLIFPSKFFELLQLFCAPATISDDILIQAKLKILELPSLEHANAAYLVDDDQDQSRLDNRRQAALKQAKDDPRICALQLIGTAFRNGLKNEALKMLQTKSPEDIQAQIQGELSAELLLTSLVYSPSELSSPQHIATKNYLEAWIRQNPSRLQELVKALTGNNTLGRDWKIMIVLNDNPPNFFPTASTCGYKMEMPSTYPDQATFNSKLETLLTAGFELS